MELIKKKSASHTWRVLKSFSWGGYVTEPGQELQIGPTESLGLMLRGKIEPVDVPDVGEYLCLTDLTLPGSKEAHRAKRNEKVLLKREDAIRLMVERKIIPTNSEQWRPYGIQLRRPGDDAKEKKQREGYEQAAFEQKIWKLGIDPAQKHK